jgi:hypothetical protein
MRKLVLGLLVSGVAVLALAALALATTRRPVWTAQLSTKQEIQMVKSPAARGLFKGTLANGVLTWKLTYSGLTGPAITANVYKGARGHVGTVGVPLCSTAPPCKSGVTGTFRITSRVKRWINEHLLYVNISTGKYPNGEIRGQISVR